MGASKTGNGEKRKRSIRLSESWGKEPKECVVEWREEKRKVKKCIIQRKKKVNKEFGREMNEDVNGSRKLF